MNLVPSGEARASILRDQATTLINLGRIEEAKPLLAEAWDQDGHLNPEAYISPFSTTGEKERAEHILVDSQRRDKLIPAEGYLALSDVENTFRAIRNGIENQDTFMLDGLRTAEVWDEIRDDFRFDELIQLLDSKETHTDQYLKDHNTNPSVGS